MRITAVFLTSIAACVSVASAAECFSQRGCGNCESRDTMYSFALTFCQNYSNPGFARRGWASASSSGPGWGSESLCEGAFQNIIAQCYGNKDGGTFDYSSTHMTVAFCSCESAKKTAPAEVEA